MKQIGCFVTSHGFGHATRLSAVLNSLAKRQPHKAHIFTSVPQPIFAQSLPHYTHHNLLHDIGFVQSDAFQVDLEATSAKLQELLPYNEPTVDLLAKQCEGFSFILCDISPLGILVAKKIGIPSVLIENFTWDWIYSPYLADFPQMRHYASYLHEWFSRADYHIQTKPLCNPGKADLLCGPIFREIQTSREKVRKKLPHGRKKIVLVTMGGIQQTPPFLKLLSESTDHFFIIAGQDKQQQLGENILLLDRLSTIYHPDLINGADIVVCKSGYSTLAECYQTNKPLICIQRDGFPESKVIEEFAQQNLETHIIRFSDFLSGKWVNLLSYDIPPSPPVAARENGAEAVADFLRPLL